MSEPIVILDEQGFHLRVHDAWHHGLTREQSRRVLLSAGIDEHDTAILLDSPVWWPVPQQVEYEPNGRRHWAVDGRPVTKEGASWSFRRLGFSHDETRHLMAIRRFCYEIERRLPPPPAECMTMAEFGRVFADELLYALSLRVAKHWVRDHLRRAERRHERGLSDWKRRYEQDKPKRCITLGDFAQVLKEAQIPVLGDDVYCEELPT